MSKPRSKFQVSKTFLVQATLILVPGAIGYMVWKPGKTTEADKRKEAGYAKQIRANESQRGAMQKYFDNLKNSQRGKIPDADQEEKMNSVLLYGRDKVVRHYAYENPSDESGKK